MGLIRCANRDNHSLAVNKMGDMLVVLKGDSIYAKCKERKCKTWWKIKIDIPGIKLDFNKCAITQMPMPKNFKFKRNIYTGDIDHQPVVIGEQDG